jgi:predicted N-acyltransferase
VVRKISEVRHTTRISDISRNAWGELASITPAADYDWLRTLEEARLPWRDTFYWWIEDQQGVVAVVAGNVLKISSVSSDTDRFRYGFFAHVVRPLRRFLQPRPTLVCGNQFSPGYPILTREDLDTEDHRIAVNRLLDAIESYCRSHQYDLNFCWLLEKDKTLGKLFSSRRYLHSACLPFTALDIRWDSWQAYLDYLKANHSATEKSIRSQVNRGRRSGVVIEDVEDPSAYEAEIHNILTEHYFRKNQSDLSLNPKLPTILKNNLGDRALIYIARKDDQVIGVGIYVRNRSAMHWHYFGIADEFVRSRNAVYFNLAYHHPIEQAINAGCKQIVMGTVPYRVKHSRGVRLLPVSNLVWQPNRLLGWLYRIPFAYSSWRQNRKLRPFLD